MRFYSLFLLHHFLGRHHKNISTLPPLTLQLAATGDGGGESFIETRGWSTRAKGEDGERRDVISALLSEDVEGLILEKGWGTASSLAHRVTISQRKFGRI